MSPQARQTPPGDPEVPSPRKWHYPRCPAGFPSGFFLFPLLLVLLGVSSASPATVTPLASEEVLDAARASARVFDGVPALAARARGEAATLSPEFLAQARAHLRALEREEGQNSFWWLAWGIVAAAGQDPAGAARAYQRASELAGGELATRWRLMRAFQALGREAEAWQELQRLRLLRLRLGVDRLTFLADELVRTARRLAATGNWEAAERTIALAVEFDPVSPEVHLARAGLLFRRGQLLRPDLPGAVGGALRGFYADLSARYVLAVNLLGALLLAVPVALVLLAALLALRHFPLLHHEVEEVTRFRLAPALQRAAVLFLLALPLLLGLGGLWFAIFTLMLLAAYLRGRERLVASAALVLAALAPIGAKGFALLYEATTSPRMVALIEVERGGRSRGLLEAVDRWAAQEPAEVLPLLARGLLHRRRGELAAARVAYQRALVLAPDLPVAHVNLGNIAFLQGESERARQAYERALALRPNDPIALFNLSQYQTEQLRLEAARASYEAAIAGDPALADRLALAAQGRAERALADAPLPAEEIWRMVLAGPAETRVLAAALWGHRLPLVSPRGAPWVLGGAAVLLWVVARLRRARGHALPCERCGRPFCPKCQPFFREGQWCARCATALKREEGGETANVPRRRTPGFAVGSRRRFTLLLSLLLPGAGHVYTGSAVVGYSLLLLALWAALQGLVLPWTRALLHLPQPAEGLFAAASGVLLLACYLWSVRARGKVTG